MSKPAPTHVSTTTNASRGISFDAPRQEIGTRADGSTFAMGFSNQANMETWTAQNAFALGEISQVNR